MAIIDLGEFVVCSSEWASTGSAGLAWFGFQLVEMSRFREAQTDNTIPFKLLRVSF